MRTFWLPRMSWRQAFLLLASFVVVLAVSLSALATNAAREDAALVPAWFELWERCRVAIEVRQPINITGLIPTVMAAPSDLEQSWAPLAGGPFILTERHRTGPAGTTRSCELKLGDAKKSLSAVGLARITFAFAQQRSLLMNKRSHKSWDSGELSGITTLGFGPIDPDPAGCMVVSVLFAAPEDRWFNTVTGEQPASCNGGPPLAPNT